MRVISGKARSLRLKTIEGDLTRPTTDRIKETLFNIINNQLYDINFIDFFAGSGGIGIEALSRGAQRAYFIDSSKQCQKCITENLKFTRLIDYAEIICKDYIMAVDDLERKKVCADIIFMDPPYNNGFEEKLLQRLSGSSIINNNTLIIVEASIETDFSFAFDLKYEIIKEKIYKTNKHIFLKYSNV